MNRFLLSFFMILAQIYADPGKNYLWPTNASEFMSSSFCEYRPGHYHTAIDIKTWNQEGYPCYAIADGTIEKIRISPFGYGKVLYLKLQDGNMAVYAHLQKFADALEKQIYQKQLDNQRYTLDWTPANWQVKKGEIIAYTGQTGIGVPHLHFEIRDLKQRPMNPLHFYNNLKDSKAPILKSLLIIPLTKNSRVNDSVREKAFELTYLGDHVYIIKEPLRVSGRIGLAVEGYDQADAVHNKFAFYRMKLDIDNKTIFRSQYDFLDFEFTSQVDIEIFYPQRIRNHRLFHKLYYDSYNQLPFYERNLGNGMIDIGQQDLPFRIEISDFHGNQSVIIGTLQASNTIPAKMQLMTKMNDLAYLRLELPQNLKNLNFASSTEGEHWNEIGYFEILERTFKPQRQFMLIKVKLNSVSDEFIKTSIATTTGELSETSGSFEDSATPQVHLRVENLGKFLILEFHPIHEMAGIQLVLKDLKSNHNHQPQIIANKYEKVIDADHFINSPLQIRLFNNQINLMDTTLDYHTLLPNQMQQFNFFNDSCQIFTGPESVYDTLLFEANRFVAEASQVSTPILSPLLHLNSAPYVLKKGIHLKMKYSQTAIPSKHIGLYSMDEKKDLNLISSQVDSMHNSVSGSIRSFGEFVIAADTTAPILSVEYPSDGQRLTSLQKIKLKAFDEISGIGSDKNISIAVDQQFVLPEWDPELDSIIGRLHWNLEPGEHDLFISVSDNAGNQAKKHLKIVIE